MPEEPQSLAELIPELIRTVEQQPPPAPETPPPPPANPYSAATNADSSKPNGPTPARTPPSAATPTTPAAAKPAKPAKGAGNAANGNWRNLGVPPEPFTRWRHDKPMLPRMEFSYAADDWAAASREICQRFSLAPEAEDQRQLVHLDTF